MSTVLCLLNGNCTCLETHRIKAFDPGSIRDQVECHAQVRHWRFHADRRIFPRKQISQGALQSDNNE